MCKIREILIRGIKSNISKLVSASTLHSLRVDVCLHAKGADRAIMPVMGMLQSNTPVRCATVDSILPGVERIHSLLHIPGKAGITPAFNV